MCNKDTIILEVGTKNKTKELESLKMMEREKKKLMPYRGIEDNSSNTLARDQAVESTIPPEKAW